MAKNRVFFQFPAVNDSLDQLCRKREQQKAKRCCREQEQNFSHLPNSVKDKAEFCFQKCFHISRSDFRFISSSSIWPHIAPKDAFFMFLSYHVFVILQPSFRIFPQIYTFASSQTFRQAPLFISEFPQALCVTLPPMFRQAPLFLSKFSQAICVASPRRSGKRRFLGKKSSKDVTRRTGLLAQHIFPDASLLFFVLFSNKTKTSLSHATNFKKLYGEFFHYF